MGWLTGRIADGRARVLGSRFERRAGRWWVSFQVEVDRSYINSRRCAPEVGPTVGIDLGIKVFATIAGDDGTVTEVANPRHLQQKLWCLRRANKALARRQSGSANRAKAARALAKVHLDVAHARADFLHKLTTSLTRTNSVIVVEDLSVAGMVRNRRLARHISDLGMAEFRRQLEYKATWYGSGVLVADRWYPLDQDVQHLRSGERHPDVGRPALDVPVWDRPRPRPHRSDQPPTPRGVGQHHGRRAVPRRPKTPVKATSDPEPSGQRPRKQEERESLRLSERSARARPPTRPLTSETT